MASSISAGTTSSTALVCTADTTGALVLQTNNGTTALTLSTAQNATFAGTLTTASRGIAKASMPAGTLLQVVQGTYSTQTSMTGSTPTATGITAAITPTSSTNKILITVYIPVYNASPGANANYKIYRNGSYIADLAYYQTSDTGSNPLITPYSATYYDSPATTSATTYAIYAVTAAGATHYWAFGNFQCNITLMEIAV